MKGAFKTAVIALSLGALAFGAESRAVQSAKEPGKYDCRVVVGYRSVLRGNKVPDRIPIWACPHKDKLAAGKCETSWLFGMRCKS